MLVSHADRSIGGTERQAHLLAVELASRGVPVTIVTQSGPPAVAAAVGPSRGAAVPIVRLPILRALPAWSFLASFLVWGALHRHRFRLIHAHNTSLGVIAGIAGHLLGKPVLAKVTGMRHVHALGSPAPLRRLRRWVLTRHARLIALSADMRAALAQAGVRLDGVELVPNGVAPVPAVSPERLAALRAERLDGHPGAVVLFVGHLTEGKRVDRLLHVWADMPRPAGALLVVVGDGPLRRPLVATADRLGLHDAVRFVGVQTDVTPFYLIADVFVLPSASEGMSNALLEAMAAGLPVVASDIAANRELVQSGRNGFLVDWADTVAAGSVLSTLLADGALRGAVGRAARERAAWFSIETVAARYCRLYAALTHARVAA
jgi:glycosyltransferase involved in cell wall biosynthesis